MILSLIFSTVPDWFPFDEPLSNSSLYVLATDDDAWLTQQVRYVNTAKQNCYESPVILNMTKWEYYL